jgi:methylaspartate ammonia-lyase
MASGACRALKRRSALKIEKVLVSVGRGSFLHSDSLAIQSGKAKANGYLFDGKPMLPGFDKIKQASYIASIMLVLDDGSVAFGDCVDVAAAGFSGRDRVFKPAEHMDDINTYIVDVLTGQEVGDFRPWADRFDVPQANGHVLHTAVRYGVTQALLHATALSRREQMVEVIAREYAADGAEISTSIPKILASCMRDNYNLHDRMILKRADILPHANFGIVDLHVGADGGLFLDYISKFANRVKEIGDSDYQPSLHFDVYGAFAKIVDYDLEKLADYLGRCRDAVSPYPLMIESPIVAPESRQQQIDLYKELRTITKRKGIDVICIVDEWCNTVDDVIAFGEAEAVDMCQIKTPDLGGINNTIEAALFCKRVGMGYYLGGSNNETDQSSRITTHIGLCCAPDFLLTKPGMGADEALALQTNEMSRTLAILAAR